MPPSNAAGWLARTHADRDAAATAGPPCAPPSPVPAAPLVRADDIAPKRRWSTTFARLDHIPARASGNDAVQNELQRTRYRRNSDKDRTRTHLMRGNDISRRDASLAKRNTLFQAYGNIPQVIMIDLARVGSVLNQPAYRQDDSDGPLSGAPMASSSEGGFDAYSCTLNTLHAARVDQMLTPDGMVKIITAEAPQTFILWGHLFPL